MHGPPGLRVRFPGRAFSFPSRDLECLADDPLRLFCVDAVDGEMLSRRALKGLALGEKLGSEGKIGVTLRCPIFYVFIVSQTWEVA